MKSMLKRWVPGVALFLSCSLLGTACFGSFTLTRKVYSFNKSMENKFVQTIVMWAFSIVPVYSVAATVDVVILNVLEFWTGSNPLAMAPGEEKSQDMVLEGRTFRMTIADQGQTLKIAEVIEGTLNNPLVLRTNANGDALTITTEDGRLVADVQKENDGLFISDRSGEVLAHVEAQEIRRAEDYAFWSAAAASEPTTLAMAR